MCDCVSKLDKALQEQTGDPTAHLETVVSVRPMGSGLAMSEARPRMTATYRPQKQDGTPGKRERSTVIYPSFCPFCGEEYEPEDGEERT